MNLQTIFPMSNTINLDRLIIEHLPLLDQLRMNQQAIFPMLNTINLAMLIIEHLPLLDQLSLSGVNSRARAILSNEFFEKNLWKELKIRPSNLELTIGISKHNYLYNTPGQQSYELYKLNRIIKQITSTHPTFCWKLLTKVFLKPNCHFALPITIDNEQMRATFIESCKTEKLILEDKIKQLCGNGPEGLQSIIQFASQDKLAAEDLGKKTQNEIQERINVLMTGKGNTIFFKELVNIVTEIGKIGLPELKDYDFVSHDTGIKNALNNFKAILANKTKELNLTLENNQEKISQTRIEERKELIKLFFNIIEIASHKSPHVFLEETTEITNKLIPILNSTLNKNISTKEFYNSHQSIIANVKDFILLGDCKKLIKESLNQNENKEELLSNIRNLINASSPKIRTSIWSDLYLNEGNSIQEDNWGETHFHEHLDKLFECLKFKELALNQAITIAYDLSEIEFN